MGSRSIYLIGHRIQFPLPNETAKILAHCIVHMHMQRDYSRAVAVNHTSLMEGPVQSSTFELSSECASVVIRRV